MGDGGKGSRQRKAEVPQAVVDSNWDTIFKKKHKEITDAASDCGCYTCMEKKIDPTTFMPASINKFIVCPKCGNKRCPHATDHNFECTNSNEPGQTGSRY